MHIQINVWGSKELVRELVERQDPLNWLSGESETSKKEILSLYPMSFHKPNTQLGSVMPKMLRYYDLTDSRFIAKEAIDLSDLRAKLHLSLVSYRDDFFLFGNRRYSDKDQIMTSTYFNDSFTTHNIYSKDADERFLVLLHKQLQNLDPKHCYMTKIRAYNPQFDTCYQSVSVKSPQRLHDQVYNRHVEIQQSWLGQYAFGYIFSDLLTNCSYLPMSIKEDAIISPREMHTLMKSKDLNVDTEAMSKLELLHTIKWIDPIIGVGFNLIYDLFGFTGGHSFNVLKMVEEDAVLLEFDWNNV